MEIESGMFLTAFILFALSSVGYLIFMLSGKKNAAGVATVITWIGFCLQTAAMATRGVRAGRIPGYTFSEYVSLFAWLTVLAYLIIERARRSAFLGIFVVPIGLVLMGYASVLPGDIKPLIPMLRSVWLQIHIITTAVAYSAFTLAFGSSIFYILFRNSSKRESALSAADGVSATAAATGFFFLTLGIITGAIWAQFVWASFWSWDPKETASLVTWLVYAAYLHTRYTRRWRGAKAAVLLVIGFFCVAFTFLGVDLLVPRTHRFLFPGGP